MLEHVQAKQGSVMHWPDIFGLEPGNDSLLVEQLELLLSLGSPPKGGR